MVTNSGQSTTGMLVAQVFEGRYEEKENGLARAAREEAALQKMFTNRNIKAQAVPDCLGRLLARKMEALERDGSTYSSKIFHYGIQ